MARLDELRLMARVARMYFKRDMLQSAIAEQLGISQSTVSRLLRKSRSEGIVRISVNTPNGVHSELEEQLVDKYQLVDAVVVDTLSLDDEKNIIRDIGSAAAYYIETVIKPKDIIGISSWSSTLLALVDAMHPLNKKGGNKIVQILGGVGNPSAEKHANRLTSRFANLVNGEAVFLPAPGVVGSPETLALYYKDEYVTNTINLFDHISMALVGIGAVQPSPLLAESGNIFSEEELDTLRSHGAVGDILLHFFDEDGSPVKSFLDNRVISMRLNQLRNVERSIGVAGGQRKLKAIRAALRGKWINILITDNHTANRLINPS